MKNFKVTAKEDGKEYWISRAHAVVGIVFAIYEGKVHFLVSKRGPGCPDHVGKWACTCGYLDWGETREEATRRELCEELGLDTSSIPIKHFCTIDDPTRDARENIVSRYLIKVDFCKTQGEIDSGKINCNTESRKGEKDEVSDIKFIVEDDISNYDWAFNHGEVLSEVLEYLRTGVKPDYCKE